MAKKNQIPLPDGTAVQLPAWASESTLEAMALQLQRANVLTDSLLGGVKELKEVDQAVIDSVNATIKGVSANSKANADQAKDKKDKIIGAVGAVSKAATFFGDAEKPLSSMVGAVSELVNKLQGPGGKDGLKKLTKRTAVFDGFLSKFGGAMNVASDIVLALAGWNAAKFEQFAEVQKKMIDSGAIFYGSAKEFDKLYDQSFKAGITYNAFSDTVQNFGGTMTALGGDVSMGSRKFLTMFKEMSESTDSMGDLGMKNTELMNSYASYIETQRLGGVIFNGVANQGDKLQTGFQDLVVEATAMASLTALNRNDILQKQMAAISDTFAAGGLSKLRENGFKDQAVTAEAFLKQLALVKDVGPGSSLMEELGTGFNNAIFMFADKIGQFDLKLALTNETRSAFNDVMEDGFFDRINTMVRNGEMTSQQANNFLLKEFEKMDLTKKAGSTAQGPLKAIQALQASGIQIQKDFGQYIGKSLEEITALTAETKKKLEASGTTIEAMNDMAKIFLTAQNAITLPINRLSSGLEATAEWFNKNTTLIKESATGFFNPNINSEGDPITENDDGLDPLDPRNPSRVQLPFGSNSNPEAILSTSPILTDKQEKVLLTTRLTQRQEDVKIVTDVGQKELYKKQIELLSRQINALHEEIQAEEIAKLAEKALLKREANR